MFAVYDGHGGTEVSKFVANKLPDFLKARQFWEAENIGECLQTAFVDFDEVIRSEESMKELKEICNSGKKKKAPVVDSQDEADRIDTIEESSIPLQELIQRYGRGGGGIGRSLMAAFLDRQEQEGSDDDEDEEEEEKEEGDGDKEEGDKKEDDKEEGDKEEEETKPKSKKVQKRCSKSPIQSEAKKSKSDTQEDDEEAEEAPEESEANVSTSSTGVKADEDEESDQDFVADEDVEEEQSDEEMEETDFSQFVLGAGGAETPGEDSGTTACVCLVGKDKIVVANAGDSRAVLCRAGKAVDLSVDHKPEDEVEKNRIHAAGGAIEEGRVNGGLNLSRALGDHAYKKNNALPLKDQMIT